MLKSDYRGKSLPNKVKGILFDFDGTLVELEPKWWRPMKEAFIKINGVVPETKLLANLTNIFNKFPKDQSKLFLIKVMYIIGRNAGLGRIQSLRFLKEARLAFSKARYINIPMEGIGDMLEELKERNIPLGIVTSAAGKEIESAKKVMPYIQNIPIVSRYDVKEVKPSPEPILKGLQRIGVAAENVVYIGDFTTDIQAGRAAGTMTCGVLGPYPEISKSGIEGENPDIILRKTIELLEYI